METRVSSAKSEVVISDQRPTVLVGERINPTGKRRMALSLKEGNFDFVRKEASAQVRAGAEVLDINVAGIGLQEDVLLPRVAQVIMESVEVPLCIDSSNAKALEAVLRKYKGKAIINSVTGDEGSLEQILPLVKEYKTAVIGLTVDKEGIPNHADGRLRLANKIVERATAVGIPYEDIIIDCALQSVGADGKAGLVGIQSIQKVKCSLGVNQTMGASNISFGLPDRSFLNGVFLAMAIAAGVTCPIVDAARVLKFVRASDLMLGNDYYAERYIQHFRIYGLGVDGKE